jgi:hypothetical protein
MILQKAQKLAKRKRDEEERAAKRKGKRTDEEGNKERFEKTDDAQGGDTDIFALLKIRMREDLDRFATELGITLLYGLFTLSSRKQIQTARPLVGRGHLQPVCGELVQEVLPSFHPTASASLRARHRIPPRWNFQRGTIGGGSVVPARLPRHCFLHFNIGSWVRILFK